MLDAAAKNLLFLRDIADIEPPEDRYRLYDDDQIYRLVPEPQWTGLQTEKYHPHVDTCDHLEKVQYLLQKSEPAFEDELPKKEMLHSADTNCTATDNLSERTCREQTRYFANVMLNKAWFETLMMVTTMWALFAEDARLACFEREVSNMADMVFWGISLAVCLLFFFELSMRSGAQRGYPYSFYFWLDIVAVASMVPDFLPLCFPMNPYHVSTSAGDNGDEESDLDDGGAARAGRAARAGTKVGRLIRLLRMVRIIRLVVQKKKAHVEEAYSPSELGKALKERISQKTIVFVIILMLGSTVLDLIWKPALNFTPETTMAQIYISQRQHAVYGSRGQQGRNYGGNDVIATTWAATQGPRSFYEMREIFGDMYCLSVPFFRPNLPQRQGPNMLAKLELFGMDFFELPGNMSNVQGDEWINCSYEVFKNLPGSTYEDKVYEWCPPAIHRLRPNEMTVYRIYNGSIGLPSFGHVPINEVGYDAGGDIVMEVWISDRPFVIAESVYGILLTLLVTMLLAIMAFLFSRDADGMVIRPIEGMVDTIMRLAANPGLRLKTVETVRYETDALYVSLAKIARLLQVGFGEAGNHLVAENLKHGDTIDLMVPGKKLLGAYGFCIIDEYEDVLECLGEEILPFTNKAAEVVHKAVVANGGQPNRNLGDAFLCVWKPMLPNFTVTNAASPAELAAAETKMCDGALTAFRTCVRKVSCSYELQAYNKNDEIVKYFDGQYSTVIGFGLHYGWAIEGAVGTNIKIDCSYLSPNVNLAARLESATKMYGVNILMSQHFVSKLSATVRKGLRRVDVVCLKGSSMPMEIYTCDRSNALYVAPEAIVKHGEQKVLDHFQKGFEGAMTNFVNGDWMSAKVGFEAVLEICPLDKPSWRILWHMDTDGNRPGYGLATTPYVSPTGWNGHHVLMSK